MKPCILPVGGFLQNRISVYLLLHSGEVEKSSTFENKNENHPINLSHVLIY